MNEPGADWTAWFLRFVFGCVVGGVAATATWLEGMGQGWDYPVGLVLFVVGGAVAVGGASALHGERLWAERGAYMDKRKEESHSVVSKRLAVCAMVGGATAAGGALLGRIFFS